MKYFFFQKNQGTKQNTQKIHTFQNKCKQNQHAKQQQKHIKNGTQLNKEKNYKIFNKGQIS